MCACASFAPRSPAGSLGSRLEPFFHRRGVTIAVAYRDLGSGETFFRNEDEMFHAASTMKVPVLMAVFQAVDAGELRLTEPVAVRNRFQSIVDGSPFALDPQADGDPDLYQAAGGFRPLEELVRRMIVRSSNLAANLLIERIGASRASVLVETLAESSGIALVGGAVGVLIAAGVVAAASSRVEMPLALEWPTLAASFAAAAAAGVAAGWYPARRAAALDVIAALRQE